MDNILAFDATRHSARHTDENGFLYVDSSHISKATVNPYYGREIPGWQDLHLDPNRVYYGLRAPDELAASAPTWRGLPLHLDHHIDSAEKPKKLTRIGSVGSEIRFAPPYLDAPLTIWDQDAIDSVQDGSFRELSCAYRYDPDFSHPGEYNGQHYDFVMRNIRGNHVALVEEGRAGNDVLVADSALAEDADRWITVHPNGMENKGRPALIDEQGTVKAGMGGKFNGRSIDDIPRGKDPHLVRNEKYQAWEGRLSDAEYEKGTIRAHQQIKSQLESEAAHGANDPANMAFREQHEARQRELADAYKADEAARQKQQQREHALKQPETKETLKFVKKQTGIDLSDRVTEQSINGITYFDTNGLDPSQLERIHNLAHTNTGFFHRPAIGEEPGIHMMSIPILTPEEKRKADEAARQKQQQRKQALKQPETKETLKFVKKQTGIDLSDRVAKQENGITYFDIAGLDPDALVRIHDLTYTDNGFSHYPAPGEPLLHAIMATLLTPAEKRKAAAAKAAATRKKNLQAKKEQAKADALKAAETSRRENPAPDQVRMVRPITVSKETDKAVQTEIKNAFGEKIWLPKSQVKVVDGHVVHAAGWLLKKHGLSDWADKESYNAYRKAQEKPAPAAPAHVSAAVEKVRMQPTEPEHIRLKEPQAIVRETAKAVAIKDLNGNYVWLPKSQIKTSEGHVVHAAGWVLKQKGHSGLGDEASWKEFNDYKSGRKPEQATTSAGGAAPTAPATPSSPATPPIPAQPAVANFRPSAQELSSLDDHTLQQKVDQYNRVFNEGGYGHNPYKDESDRRQIQYGKRLNAKVVLGGKSSAQLQNIPQAAEFLKAVNAGDNKTADSILQGNETLQNYIDWSQGYASTRMGYNEILAAEKLEKGESLDNVKQWLYEKNDPLMFWDALPRNLQTGKKTDIAQKNNLSPRFLKQIRRFVRATRADRQK